MWLDNRNLQDLKCDIVSTGSKVMLLNTGLSAMCLGVLGLGVEYIVTHFGNFFKCNLEEVRNKQPLKQ